MAETMRAVEELVASEIGGLKITNPVTGETIGTVPVSTSVDVVAAVERARQAQPGWAMMSVKERGRILRRWGDLMWEQQQEAMSVIRSETGKNDTGAFLEIAGIDNTVGYCVQYGPRLLKPEKRKALFPFVQRAYVYHKPHGVAGFIAPWNYPMALAMIDVIPALIAGNAIIIKPSEVTPYSALYAVDLLQEAGLPEHIAQVVTGDGTTGAALVDVVDYVSFTGSTAVGRQVAATSARRLIPFSMELGGKDSMIVLKDARIDVAAASVFIGACENAGQMCLSIERVYVEAPIYDQFLEKVLDFTKQLIVGAGDGFDVHVGSMTNEIELLRVEEHIQDALDKGAKLLFGGKRLPEIGPLFFEPGVLVDVDHSMKVMTEETFGPLIPIMRVADDEEAIRLANDSVYGLSSVIFTGDSKRGQQLAARLDTGDVSINRVGAVMGAPHLPWGGQKASGMGRRGGPEGILRFTTSQSIVVDTQIGLRPALTLLDPFTLRMVKLVRWLRLKFPFL
jgi:succinate-semialdehyde dehydrogenase / glutarate-semialdehyde dehydrogenase